MIDDVDAALVNLLRDGLPKGTEVHVGPPAPEAGARRAALSLFLHDVREDLSRRQMDAEPVREGSRVTRRVVPPRQFQLSYMVTAQAADDAAEHRLLSEAIRILGAQEHLPQRHLVGGLAQMNVQVLLALWPRREGPAVQPAPDIWSALGMPLRASLDLQVTSPLVPVVVEEVGPPVVERVLDLEIPEKETREQLREPAEVVTRRRAMLVEGAAGREPASRTRRG